PVTVAGPGTGACRPRRVLPLRYSRLSPALPNVAGPSYSVHAISPVVAFVAGGAAGRTAVRVAGVAPLCRIALFGGSTLPRQSDPGHIRLLSAIGALSRSRGMRTRQENAMKHRIVVLGAGY